MLIERQSTLIFSENDLDEVYRKLFITLKKNHIETGSPFFTFIYMIGSRKKLTMVVH